MRYPLIDGQVTAVLRRAIPRAAMRYNRSGAPGKKKATTEDILADTQKETVDFIPNFDQKPSKSPSSTSRCPFRSSSSRAPSRIPSVWPHKSPPRQHFAKSWEAAILLIEKPDAHCLKRIMNIFPPVPAFPTAHTSRGGKASKPLFVPRPLPSFHQRAKAPSKKDHQGQRKDRQHRKPDQVQQSRLLENGIADSVPIPKKSKLSPVRDEVFLPRRHSAIVPLIEARPEGVPAHSQPISVSTPRKQEAFGMNPALHPFGGQPRELGLNSDDQAVLEPPGPVKLVRPPQTYLSSLRKRKEREHIQVWSLPDPPSDHLETSSASSRGSAAAPEAKENLFSSNFPASKSPPATRKRQVPKSSEAGKREGPSDAFRRPRPKFEAAPPWQLPHAH